MPKLVKNECYRYKNVDFSILEYFFGIKAKRMSLSVYAAFQYGKSFKCLNTHLKKTAALFVLPCSIGLVTYS